MWPGQSPREWNERLADLAAFIDLNERLPGSTGPRDEGSLYRWMTAQDHRLAMGALNNEQVIELRRVKGSLTIPAEAAWWERAHEIEALLHHQGRLPLWRERSERTMYHWLNNQKSRARRGRLSPDQADFLGWLRDASDQASPTRADL